MNAVGIICEYNPFHNGHSYQISKIKKSLSLPVVCVMSGNFVQRGQYSLFDKYLRASFAVSCGADLVLELPYPFSCSSAEIFASSGIEILQKTAICDGISFGSESGDVKRLRVLASFLDGSASREIRKLQKEQPNLSYAHARERYVLQKLGREYSELLRNPNDILSVEYLRAIERKKANLTPVVIKREGGFHDQEPDDLFSSASFIRENRSDSEKVKPFLPDIVFRSLDKARSIDDKLYFAALCGSILTNTPQEIKKYAEVPAGMEYMLYNGLSEAANLQELYEKMKRRHFTDAKLRRAVLYSFLKTEKERLTQMPQYTTVLALNETGRALLKRVKGKSEIPILSKISDIKKANTKAKDQFYHAKSADEIFSKLSVNG